MFRNPTTDLIVILVIVLLIFGPKRLPSLGKQLGSGIREFKDSITGDSKDDDVEPPQLQSTSTTTRADAASVNLSAERDSAEVGSSERRG
ncbi:MAG: twin-arginine translocase TatA/TatE family subunit [Solirubrobacterales bacterium]|nr:twin-arginine translocase TatA/TatE family subunit [Solirubrobacterales bacterium]MBV9716962.1 twin-arginine translocase TatA/TatE family subunit [Solirubrobacterales bacterium]